MMTSPPVSWLFFKAVRAGLAVTKRPYLNHTGRASNAEKQPTGSGPEGCDENGPAAALLVGHVSVQICSLLAPCRRPILIATKYLLFRGQDTRPFCGHSRDQYRGNILVEFSASARTGATMATLLISAPSFLQQLHLGPNTSSTI